MRTIQIGRLVGCLVDRSVCHFFKGRKVPLVLFRNKFKGGEERHFFKPGKSFCIKILLTATITAAATTTSTTTTHTNTFCRSCFMRFTTANRKMEIQSNTSISCSQRVGIHQYIFNSIVKKFSCTNKA